MQKTIYRFILMALAFSVFSSCDNELDITADWKEIAIVYGVLNPTDAQNYIRIQRAYLDETTGALAFSDIPDSLYFDSLQVSLTEFHNGQEGNTYRLTKVDGNQIGLEKDSGLFQSEVNYLYQLNAEVKASSFFHTYEYRLTVFNPYTGNLVTSSTPSVGRAEIEAPVNDFSEELLILADTNYKIISVFQEGKFARAYDQIMRIRLEEINREDTSDREVLELDWVMFRNRSTKSLAGFNESIYPVSSKLFFTFIQSQLDAEKNVKRRLLNFDIYNYGISDDLNTYINVNQPSIGIVQKKPEYTNIENGFGIFASRHISRVVNKRFHPKTHEAMTLSASTADLGFE